jgi:hypothetical protein
VDEFWRGPITSRRQAGEIIRWTGWVFVSLAVAPIIFSLYAPRVTVYFSFITAILSIFILWKQSYVAAGLLFGLVSLLALGSCIGAVLVAWYAVANDSYGIFGGYLLGTLVWIPFVLLTWRAFRATKAWPELNRGVEVTPRFGPPWLA